MKKNIFFRNRWSITLFNFFFEIQTILDKINETSPPPPANVEKYSNSLRSTLQRSSCIIITTLVGGRGVSHYILSKIVSGNSGTSTLFFIVHSPKPIAKWLLDCLVDWLVDWLLAWLINSIFFLILCISIMAHKNQSTKWTYTPNGIHPIKC